MEGNKKDKWSLIKPISSNKTAHDLYFEDRHVGTLEIKNFNADALIKRLNENDKLRDALQKAKEELRSNYKIMATSIIKAHEHEAEPMWDIHCKNDPLIKEINELLKGK